MKRVARGVSPSRVTLPHLFHAARDATLDVRLQPVQVTWPGKRELSSWLRNPSGPDDESLVIEGVQPGRYWVKVDSTRGFVSAVSSGATDLQHHPLIVGPGGSSSPIEIIMRDDTAEIDGSIEGLASSLTGSVPQTADGSSAHLYCIPLPDSSGDFKDIWVPPDGIKSDRGRCRRVLIG